MPRKEDDGPTIEDITDLDLEELDDDEPLIEELEEEEENNKLATANGTGHVPHMLKDYRNPAKPLTDLTRDGVPLTEALIRRKAEHNEGMLSTLEEIALHQLDIDKIESLNNCRCLKIVYLQSNLIRKIEGLHRLKQLDYLNLALNNITKIENLERCEALRKLDLTVNFIDLDELHTVGSLKNNTILTELFLTGNPCQAHWESGFRDYVIATLPQLETLDGTEVMRTERIKALQRLPELERELASLVPLCKQRKAELKERRKERRRQIESGELVETTETTDEWCEDVRVADARELREIELEKEENRKKAQNGGSLFSSQPARERRFFKDDGTPIQMNTAKWPFSIDEDALNVYVDIALPKFLDSAQVDADVQPTYVRVQAGHAIKEGRGKQTIQLVLPSEVLTDSAVAKRSATTGHLLLTCPKMHPVVTSKAPAQKKKAQAIGSSAEKAGLLPAPPSAPSAPGAGLKGLGPGDSIRSIVASKGKGSSAEPAPAIKPTLGPDFDDEDEVPPLL